MERVGKAQALRVLVVVGLVVASVAAMRPSPVGAQQVPGAIPGQYIMTLQAGVDPFAKADEHARTHSVGLLHVYQFALTGYAAVIPAARLAQVEADPAVIAVSPDREIYAIQDSQAPGGPPSDPDATETLPTGVDRIDAEGQGPGAPVAVIDTVIDLDHPDLNVAGGVNCTSGPSYDDGNGHGTHVAGTIGAYANGFGVVGVAPGTPVYAVRVLNNGGFGTWSSVICGVDWVSGSGITIANMSLGGGGSDDGNCGYTDGDALHQAICTSVNTYGVTYAVAAGNDALDAAGSVPAAYDEVITVSALADFDGQRNAAGAATCRADEDDSLANFSNYGADVDVAAPGVCILSTWPDGYNTISGTSMASPHVAGALALGGYGLETDPIDDDGVCGMVDDPDGINEGILSLGRAVKRCS
ncbi:MAG: S8 family serine peptidase [Chloroflexota bacterium]|nr:S8 family serine peptidase [Chloroflexota bacterium]